MKKHNLKFGIVLVLCSSCAIASLNGSPALNASASTNTLTETTGVNPFSTGQQSLTAPTYAPSLVIREKELLSQEVKKWVEGNGYKLYWNSKKDYVVYNNITLSGKTDDDILQSLGELFFSENNGLVVKKYQKNRVIVIDDM